MIDKLKKFKRVVSGKDFFIKKTLSVSDKKVGSTYGGVVDFYKWLKQ